MSFLREFGALYMDKRLTRASAALSYFLTMTLFPFLIILYTMLGNSYDKAMRVLAFAKNFIAAESADAIAEFLRYVAANNSTAMMIAAMLVLLTSASAAVRSLQATIGEMQGGQRYQGLTGFVFSVIFSLLFVAASEWWLRGLDSGKFLGIEAPNIFRNGFRLVVFSIIIMIVVLFFREGIMGEKELPDLFKKKKKAPAKEAQS